MLECRSCQSHCMRCPHDCSNVVYLGDRVQMTLLFRKTVQGWKLDDIQTSSSKFVDRQTLGASAE